MKKTTILLISFLLPLLTWGQAQINTKKVKIADFTGKVTKVVLTGNDFFDAALSDEIAARWRISPYEFCTLQEFDSLRTSDEYYFLMSVKGQFKKEDTPGLQYLTLVKGGAGAEEGIDEMLEVVSMPIASAKFPSGRELVFLPAFTDIIQTFTIDAMDKDINAYTGLANYSKNLPFAGKMDIVFSEDDLSPQVSSSVREMYFDDGIIVTDECSADEYLEGNADNTLVSFVAAPYDAEPGSYCYTMLIDTRTHKLYYYRKHRITKKAGPGFVPEDIIRISSNRSKIEKKGK